MALDRVNLEFGKGSVYGIIGANGSGKTTLLSVIGGWTKQTSGTVSFPRRSNPRMGFVGDLPLDWAFTGTEYLASYGAMLKIPPHRYRELARRALEICGGSDFFDDDVSLYSRGMCQRLALARALLCDPHVLLLDEPLTGLDVEGRSAFSKALVNSKRGRTVLLVTHDMAIVNRVCDKVIVLRNGRVSTSFSRSKSAQELMIVFDRRYLHRVQSKSGMLRDGIGFEKRRGKVVLTVDSGDYSNPASLLAAMGVPYSYGDQFELNLLDSV